MVEKTHQMIQHIDEPHRIWIQKRLELGGPTPLAYAHPHANAGCQPRGFENEVGISNLPAQFWTGRVQQDCPDHTD